MCFAHFLHVMNAIQDSGSSFWFFFFCRIHEDSRDVLSLFWDGTDI